MIAEAMTVHPHTRRDFQGRVPIYELGTRPPELTNAPDERRAADGEL